MQTTGKHFVMDEKFSLGDLLALELHNYVDACSEIVDRAQKELNIEKQLKKIEDTWSGLNLVFAPYQVRGCCVDYGAPSTAYNLCRHAHLHGHDYAACVSGRE